MAPWPNARQFTSSVTVPSRIGVSGLAGVLGGVRMMASSPSMRDRLSAPVAIARQVAGRVQFSPDRLPRREG